MNNFPYVFLELVIDEKESHIYVGKNLQVILDDTENGTKFGGVPISFLRPLSLEQVKDLQLPLFSKAIEALQKGDPCFYIGQKRVKHKK